ncbi:MAG: chemotaxis protein CheA [Archangium sp.]|nr:chemotaxis protein CheA [Archangium sp.]
MAPRALTDFVAEATEILDTLDRELMALEERGSGDPDPDRLNAIFRASHSLKGLSAMFGLEGLARLSHRAEDLLDALRLGKVHLDDTLLEALSQTVDVLHAMLGEAARGEDTADVKERAEVVSAELRRLARGQAVESGDVLDAIGIDPSVRAVFTEYEEHRLRENVKKGVGLWKVRAVFGLDDFDTRLTELNRALKPLGEVVSTLPSSQPGDDASIAFDLIFGSGRDREEIQGALIEGSSLSPLGRVPVPPPSVPLPTNLPPKKAPVWDDVSVSGPALTPISSSGSGISSSPSGLTRLSGGAPVETSMRSLTNTVRVDIGRLDGLMNSIGELLLIRSNIERLAEAARQTQGTALPKLWGQELQREARSLERRLDELQKGVLEVRMVPLGQVFDKLARLMRRLVKESGKDIAFDVSGGDVELDKLIVEELSDPLMHLLRNALDHGVEQPEQRQARGKSGRATIGLVARQQGNHVIIEVKDDGNGLDEARIREVAIERGLVTRDQTEEMERRELLNLVFQPGFSTRRDVSELSGRGVGLDVVKTNLQRLSGLIDIESRRAQGTTFTLTLPLTLAIIRALMVSVSGRTYAIPLNSVLEIVQIRTDALKTIEKREVIEVRGQTLPFIRLARVFGLPEEPRVAHYVVLVGLAQQRLGLAIDDLLGQQDIVTKPLSGRLRGIPGIAGATELGDRRAVLVLDVGALMEELMRATPTSTRDSA